LRLGSRRPMPQFRVGEARGRGHPVKKAPREAGRAVRLRASHSASELSPAAYYRHKALPRAWPTSNVFSKPQAVVHRGVPPQPDKLEIASNTSTNAPANRQRHTTLIHVLPLYRCLPSLLSPARRRLGLVLKRCWASPPSHFPVPSPRAEFAGWASPRSERCSDDREPCAAP